MGVQESNRIKSLLEDLQTQNKETKSMVVQEHDENKIESYEICEWDITKPVPENNNNNNNDFIPISSDHDTTMNLVGGLQVQIEMLKKKTK